MENYRVRFLWFCLGILLLLLSCVQANHWSQPLKNVNLSPFWQWRSAYECMSNESARCAANYQIKLSGAVVVSQSEVVEYCKQGGCVEHVYYVLKCIHNVKRDFWFANKATVLDLNRTISQACATKSGFNTTIFTSSGTKTPEKVYMSLLSSLLALAFITIFNM